MTVTRYHLLFLIACCFSSIAQAQYIQVNDSYTPQQLVENVLINSNCASVSNFSVSGGSFSSGEQSYGYFNAGTSSFPFSSGVVLSTGRAVGAQGPNSSLLDDGNGMNWPGDAGLEQALEINNSVNATILEFDFIPLGNKISFSYILSSEEYHDNAPCRYSDGFAFLLSQAGSAAPPQNLAVVPNTAIPVKVTSVHPQIGGNGGCEAQNEQYFNAFNDFEHPTNFNGQTKPLLAQAEVTPGILYHIKLVIADEGNYRYDSAIFLEAGSFKVETDLGNDRLLAAGNPLCGNETLVLNAYSPNAVSYKWFKNNALEASQTSPSYPVTQAGNYKVEVELAGSCISTGEIAIEYASNPVPSNAVLVQCDGDGDGLAYFNLNQATSQIIAGNSNWTAPAFFLNAADALANANAIANTEAFQNTQNIVYARVKNQYGCFGISEVALAVSNNNLASPDNLETCDEDSNPADGIAVFNLQENDAAILANLPGGSVNYFASFADALSGLNSIPNPQSFQNTVPFQQTIYARLSSGTDCYGIVSFALIANSFGNSLADAEATICRGSTVVLTAGDGFSSYSWNTNPVRTTQSITVSEAGTYMVTVTNSNQCQGTKTFTVTASSIAEVASVTVNDFQEGSNSATINLASNSLGIYEYSLDGINFQESPTFSSLEPGPYTVYIKDTKQCGTLLYDFYVLDYPNFFTPNQDGINDIWQIPYLEFQPSARVAIFDRYGKLVYSFKGGQPGWNGTLNGKNLFSSDYWFLLTLENGREIRGHFSLVR
ncbi:MAG TPA: choice-of-anchor L domain-containing protein [Flavobacterium sp.]|nr:choice-of-anchor L domain-containing protein [Flavobacterium sp.]